TIPIDTSNILFICGGAFDGLEKVIERRLGSSSLGFEANIIDKKTLDQTYWMENVIAKDLVKFGLIPELVGRLPVITALSGLDEQSLVRILTEPKNSLVKQYQKLFAFDDVLLEFEEGALKAIAQKAIEAQTGARGLRGILEGVLTQLMFEAPSDETIEKIVITEDSVKNGAEPEIFKNNRKLLEESAS
ncbi:MAG: AAA family ATPase, partial [Ruminococcus sp.]|nr:AAA family ATPase [Ruminococcus sp.]